jgi:hypothetical protein
MDARLVLPCSGLAPGPDTGEREVMVVTILAVGQDALEAPEPRLPIGLVPLPEPGEETHHPVRRAGPKTVSRRGLRKGV